MNDRLLGFFSGFPSRRFPEPIAKQLGEELTCRRSLVFVSAWSEQHERNDEDSTGMYGMFKEYGIFFDKYCVIDTRTEADRAAELIAEASCVFLMGGYPRLQLELMREKGLEVAIRASNSAVLGVSAGAINMAVRSLDTKESPVPYSGLGLADVTVKPHFDPKNLQVAATLKKISAELPIYAMEDDSAIFVKGDCITRIGRMHLVNNGEILSL